MNRRNFLAGSIGLTALGWFGVPNLAMAVVPNADIQIPNNLQDNPLLDFSGLPKYSKVQPDHVVPAMTFLINEAKKIIAQVTSEPITTWQDFYFPLSNIDNKLDRAWSVVTHLHSVANTAALRVVFEEARAAVSDFYTWRGMHEPLFESVMALKNSPEFTNLNIAQQKTIDDALLNFRLSGINLPAQKQQRLAQIHQRLSVLSTTFSNHVLDATNGWHQTVDQERLSGLSEQAKASLKAVAEAKGESGYRIGLDMPSYLAVINSADDRTLRYEVYHAFMTRASELGADAGKWDNGPVIAETLKLRHEMADLLGFDNYAQYSLETKMADSPDEVMAFLTELADRARVPAKAQLEELKNFAKAHHDIEQLEAWDLAYVTEKHKAALYDFDKEMLREYFPEQKVLSGLFAIAKRLFGITIKEVAADVWDPSVGFYEVYDPQNRHKASFYLDLYARENKRDGAWMSTAIDRIRHADGIVQLPVAMLVCNFRKPTEGQPSLLLHDEVTTLFHEFGHGIHLMLTQMDILGVTGLGGVPWDAIEVPSQLMEGFVLDRATLPLISAHYQTGEPLPSALLDKLFEAKHYLGALTLIRQLEFGIFDMKLHTAFDNAKPKDHAQQLYLQINQEIGVLPIPDFVRRPHTFGHIFSGGYAAGYYSYLWSQLLAADGFAKFEEEGVLNPVVGKRLEDTILGQGGSRHPMALYTAYRGREPKLDALLANYGID